MSGWRAKFPFKEFALNEAWLEIVALAHDLLVRTQALVLNGELAKAEPKRVRDRLLLRGRMNPKLTVRCRRRVVELRPRRSDSLGMGASPMFGGEPGVRAVEGRAEVVGGKVGVIERAAAVGEQFVDECDGGWIGIIGLLKRGSELEQLGAHSLDPVEEYWAAVKPPRRLGRSRRSSQPVGERSAGAGTDQSLAFAGELGQLREFGEDREGREPPLAGHVAADGEGDGADQ